MKEITLPLFCCAKNFHERDERFSLPATQKEKLVRENFFCFLVQNLIDRKARVDYIFKKLNH